MRHSRLFRAALAAVLLLSFLPAAPSAQIDTSLFAGLRWRSIGPNRGGRSQAIAGSPSRPYEYYFGAVGGGVWKTTDAGVTWRPVSDRQIKSSSPGAIQIAASNPDVVYVGMGETQLRGNIIQGDGVYKTIDAGKTWTSMGLEKTHAISRIRVHPTNPDIVFVAALGNPYGPNPERGVFRSKDGGKAWEKVLFRDDKTGGVDLVMDPKNPDVLYATLWEVFRTPHSLSSGGPGGGMFKTTDGGTTWTELSKNPGLPKPLWGKSGIAVSGADSNRLFAIIEAKDGGIFMSDDAGATWKLINDDRRIRQRAFYYSRIYGDPKAKDTFYILNVAFFRSVDAGKTLRAVQVPHSDNHDLWIDPNDPKRMANANDGGGNVSLNGGESWTGQRFPTGQFYNVFTTTHVPYHVCGAQQDNSTACVPSNGTGDELYDVGGGESGYIAPDPRDTNVFYAGSYGGLLTRTNRRTGEERAINVWPDNPMGHPSSGMTERFQWTFPIVIAPTDPKTVYVTSQHVWKSTNEGQSWQKISPDLSRHDPSTMGDSGGPITLDQTGVETYAVVFALAPSALDGNVIWAGSDDGLVHVTRDGGQNWTKVTPPDLPEFARVSLIKASPHNAGTAYLAANRYQRADRAPYVYKTSDYGATWTKIVNGVRPDDFARVIEEDPKRKGLLFLGTETGIYVSFDDGAQWQSFGLELPTTPVHGILVKNDDLVIGTHGRGFFVMDNINVLRQVGKETTNDPVVLFKPGDATRSVSRGVAVDYYLKQPADKVTIEFIDPQGKSIRTFTAPPAPTLVAPGAPAPEEGGGGRGGGAAPVPAVKQGLNRFVWDFRYPDAKTFPGLIMWAGSVRGPAAPPGQYQVRLTVGDQTKTQPFAIQRNPLGSATDEDLSAQFVLANQINGKVTAANTAVLRIRDLKEQIADRIKKANDEKIKAAGEALTEKLTAVEGEIYQYRNRSNQDPLNYPIKLNNKLAALQGIVESGDFRPTDQSQAVFKELSARLDAELGKLDALIRIDLTAFNAMVVKKKLTPIIPSQP